jgi:8-oxo-dGTP pyrophosphatase MutT (NUDIX family)
MNVSHDSEKPAHGQQIISATAFIHHNFDGVEKVFLPRRATTKKFLPDKLEMSGGHIEYGEDIVEGLKREIMEEHEMRVSIGDPFFVSTYINEVKGSHSLQATYFARFLDPLEQIKTHPEDHSGFVWLAEEEISENRASIVPQSQIAHQMEDDPEYLAIIRGFELLRGESHNFG